MSKPPETRTVLAAAGALVAAAALYDTLLGLARTSLGHTLLGLTSLEASHLPLPASPLVAALALVLALTLAVGVHARRYSEPLARLWPRALGQSAALVAGAAIVARIAGGSLSPTGSLVATAAAAGVVFAYVVWTWLRIPARLLPAPTPGQIWWAQVPFEESRQSKDRPCLVLAIQGRHATVLMFTSQDKTGRAGYAPIPPSQWRQPRHSFLRTDRRIRVRRESFRRYETDAHPGTLHAAGLVSSV